MHCGAEGRHSLHGGCILWLYAHWYRFGKDGASTVQVKFCHLWHPTAVVTGPTALVKTITSASVQHCHLKTLIHQSSVLERRKKMRRIAFRAMIVWFHTDHCDMEFTLAIVLSRVGFIWSWQHQHSTTSTRGSQKFLNQFAFAAVVRHDRLALYLAPIFMYSRSI